MTPRQISLLCAVGCLAAGCMVGPDYKRPELAVPPVYRGADAQAPVAAAATYGDLKWWSVFPDPDLQALIRTALAQNYDLRIAVARILQAQSQVTIARSQEFPTVDGSVSAPYAAYTGSDRPATLPDHSFQPQAGFDVAWELDFWGKFRRNTESARADLLATDEARYVVMATLVTQIADAYLTLRALDLTLEISRRTVNSRVQSVDLVQARLDGGVAGVLDLRQAETLLYGATKTIPDIQRQIEQQENFISILLGQNPGPIKRGRPLDQQIAAPALPPGLPLDLLTAAAGHSAGRAATGFRERADRRRHCVALSAGHDIRICRSRRRDDQRLELRAVRDIQRPAGRHPAHLQHGPPAGQRRLQRGRGPGKRGCTTSRPCSRRCAKCRTHWSASVNGRNSGSSRNCSSRLSRTPARSPTCDTRAGCPVTSKSWIRSVSSSRRNWIWSRRSATSRRA